MAKLAHGPASRHILCSGGPSHSPLHFYSTTYSCNHHRGSHPGLGAVQHHGTGYASNFRPALSYSSRLDLVDNPRMIALLSDNYDSLSAKDYVWYRSPSGREPLPLHTHHGSSGFACNLPKTTPTGRRRPHSSATEYHSTYTRKPFRDEALERSKHTHSEDSGFTHAQNIEPVTFRPPETFPGDVSPHLTWRPTGRSVMKSDFHSPQPMTGQEEVLPVSARADPSNGYVKGNRFMSDVQPKGYEMVGYTVSSQLPPTALSRARRQDPAKYSTITHPHHYQSYTHWSLESGRRGDEGQRRPEAESRGGVGKKELTGFSENNQPLVEPGTRDPAEFSTHYQHKFSMHRTVGGGPAQLARPNGFTRGTQVHRPNSDSAAVLRRLHPTVARMVLQKDPYFDDHTYDREQHHTH